MSDQTLPQSTTVTTPSQIPMKKSPIPVVSIIIGCVLFVAGFVTASLFPHTAFQTKNIPTKVTKNPPMATSPELFVKLPYPIENYHTIEKMNASASIPAVVNSIKKNTEEYIVTIARNTGEPLGESITLEENDRRLVELYVISNKEVAMNPSALTKDDRLELVFEFDAESSKWFIVKIRKIREE